MLRGIIDLKENRGIVVQDFFYQSLCLSTTLKKCTFYRDTGCQGETLKMFCLIGECHSYMCAVQHTYTTTHCLYQRCYHICCLCCVNHWETFGITLSVR